MPKHYQRVPPHYSESTEVLYVPAHIIEVQCHSISGLRQSYDYMFQELTMLPVEPTIFCDFLTSYEF